MSLKMKFKLFRTDSVTAQNVLVLNCECGWTYFILNEVEEIVYRLQRGSSGFRYHLRQQHRLSREQSYYIEGILARKLSLYRGGLPAEFNIEINFSKDLKYEVINIHDLLR